MPRLPTILVIGSQFISTRFFDLLGTSFVGAVIVLIAIAPLISDRFSAQASKRPLIRSWMVAACELRARMPPLRLLVDSILSHRAQRSDRTTVHTDGAASNSSPGGLIHEGQ